MNRRNRCVKRLCLALSLVLMLGLLPGCGGDKATTMHLEKKQGTVGVEDEKDTRMEAREGMQLYSGYEVGTAQVSQAWIGLDDTKAIKLDETSTAEIQQSGKQLTVKLYEGKLFFDVSQPLKSDETFTIETATMVTGIRGTCGWMEVVDDHTTRLVVLEGTVTVETREPTTGESRLIPVTGGQILTAAYYGDGQGREDQTIEGMIGSNVIDPGKIIHTADGLRVEQLQENRVPPFVQEEVAQSEQIQERIEEYSDLSVSEILEQQAPPQGAAQEQPEDSLQAPPEDMPQDAPQELPEEPIDAPEEIPETDEEPEPEPESEPTTGDRIPLATEVYYVEVIEPVWGQVFVEDPGTDPEVPGGSTGTTPPGGTTDPGGSTPGGGTPPGTPPAGGSAGEVQVPEDVVTTQYRPQIQLLPSATNPTYAVITQAEEVSTTTFTQNDAGEIIGTTTVELRTIPGAASQTDDVTDGTVDFLDKDGNPMSLPVRDLG